MRGPRTVLAVPGGSSRFLRRAGDSGADALMVDLEDGVAAADKALARDLVSAEVPRIARSGAAVWLRVNAVGSADFAADVACADDLGDALAAVVLPKAATEAVRVVLEAVQVPVVALVETATGIEAAAALARPERVAGLMFGALDYALDLARVGAVGATRFDWAEARLVNAAAACDAWAIAGPTPDLGDAVLLAADARRARELGYVGKLCIHPRQVATVEHVFVPSAEEVAWAERVLAASREAGEGAGAVAVGGEMVDAPVVLRARQVVAAAGKPDRHDP